MVTVASVRYFLCTALRRFRLRVLTAKAAPIMLGLAKTQPAAAVQTAFDKFFMWGLYLRGSLDTLAFAALVWALTDAYRMSK